MKLPIVYPLTIPSSHMMIRMTAIVSSMVPRLLRAVLGAHAVYSSNLHATTPSVHRLSRPPLALQIVAALALTAGLAAGQDTVEQPAATTEKNATASAASFLAGGLTGLVAHESGHLLFDTIFDAHAGVKRVSFHGVP